MCGPSVFVRVMLCSICMRQCLCLHVPDAPDESVVYCWQKSEQSVLIRSSQSDSHIPFIVSSFFSPTSLSHPLHPIPFPFLYPSPPSNEQLAFILFRRESLPFQLFSKNLYFPSCNPHAPSPLPPSPLSTRSETIPLPFLLNVYPPPSPSS